MKKLLNGVFMASILSGILMLLCVQSVNAETDFSTVTLTVHEDESDSDQTVFGGREVGLYDITSIYLEDKQAADFDEKKFSEAWSDSALKSDEGLPEPLKTATTNTSGQCQFVVPMKQNNHYAVYLIREMSQETTKKVLPSVIILPVRSLETGAILDQIDVYPKFIDGTTSTKPITPTEPSTPTEPTEPSVPEEPYTPTQPSTPSESSEQVKFGNFPSTNEMKTKASWIGAGIIVLVGIVVIARKRKTKGENK